MNLINYLIDVEAGIIKDYIVKPSYCAKDKEGLRKPSINIKDNSNDYCLSLIMPGIDKKNIIITINDGIINIKNKIKENDNKENESFQDLNNFNYSRSFYIPDDGNIDKIKAKTENGILDIVIPKLKKVKKDIKKIAVS